MANLSFDYMRYQKLIFENFSPLYYALQRGHWQLSATVLLLALIACLQA